MTWRRPLGCSVLLAAMAGLAGCTVGEGSGEVHSDQLYIQDCWQGPFDLHPTFFGANPYRQDTLLIRVQRGDNLEEVSDGLTVLVTSVAAIREGMLNQPVTVGLPPGVSPPGVPLTGAPAPLVSLSLYLHDTCHRQNGAIFSTDGTITFHSLFSGNPNERTAADRLTDAEFDATFADPRDTEAAHTSRVAGNFRFYFQRGQPAQPFS
jgi:hypothetical protein